MSLWKTLCDISDGSTRPWLVGGDFNNILHTEERIGSRVNSNETSPFKNCFVHCVLKDLKYKGSKFTWNSNQEGGDRVFCKLDRILCNEEWVDMYPDAVTDFLPEGIFYHTPAIVALAGGFHKGKTPFRYCNWWKGVEGYEELVTEAWQMPVNGNPMFKAVTKLKHLKKSLKFFKKVKHPNIETEDREAELMMKYYQHEVNNHPQDMEL